MAERSTRNKIRWQAQKAIEKAEKIMQHLQYIDELAEKRSGYINNSLPQIVYLTQMYIDTLKSFREGL